MRRSAIASLVAIALAFTSLTLLDTKTAISTPVATDDATYTAFGRVFPDPQGCAAAGDQGVSPWAKGQVCATDFLQFSELLDGMLFLEEKWPDFIEFYRLDEDFACSGKPVSNPDKACKDFLSAGLPVTADADQGEGVTRDRAPLYMVRVTDEDIPDKNKDWFVFPLSIHGIERAGVEGGTRAIEDLATWAGCEENPEPAVCALEDQQPLPHPILEPTPDKSITAGDALKRSVIYFIYPNPDGWLRGERTTGTQFFQRYNGNGVDLNRDWPEQGFTFRPYTPWSEPESRAFGRVLQAIGPKDKRGKPKWTGGIDLHGQLVDRAFSFTLIGGSQRPYDKNQRVLQTVKGAWADAELRLAWSALIKPNDAPADDPRLYGVQWGTIWDTIAYTVTGALGNWIDSPIGLNADGIDNEMSLSHVSNCGVGSCWEPELEQLHVDGNKSLVYSMINFSLKPEGNKFRTKGKVGYVFNKGFVKEKTKRLKIPNKYSKLKPQEDVFDIQLDQTNTFIHEFEVKGPKSKPPVYNGGIAVTITCGNVQGVGPCALSEARLERRNVNREGNTQGEEWETVNSYFNQSNLYVQAGQALHANLPLPGEYRIIIEGTRPADVLKADINFTKEKGWPDPGQIGYRATNMKFWKDLKPFARPRLGKLTPKKIANTSAWKRKYDTIVLTNKPYPRIARKLRKWVAKFEGNLVLTDRALRMLPAMKIVKGRSSIGSFKAYAGYLNFATARRDPTYNDKLARKINQPGAAEGQGGDEVRRRQTYEPVPIGIALQSADGSDANNSPIWFVQRAAWAKAKGEQRAVATSGNTDQISYGEIKLGGGRIRIIGAVLPMPTKKFDNPFGVANYGVTFAGYQVLLNALNWTK